MENASYSQELHTVFPHHVARRTVKTHTAMLNLTVKTHFYLNLTVKTHLHLNLTVSASESD